MVDLQEVTSSIKLLSIASYYVTFVATSDRSA